MFSTSLKPVPGYEDAYRISPEGVVVNKYNNVLKAFPTKRGYAVELRHQGQREKVLISELLRKLEEPDENTGTD